MNSIPGGAVVIDANVAIAISSKEADREPKAKAELLRYSTAGHLFYAPGAIVAETLYILCGKLQLLRSVQPGRYPSDDCGLDLTTPAQGRMPRRVVARHNNPETN